MAKATTASVRAYIKPKVSRPGVHSKTKTSKSKSSKNYKKSYKKQGKQFKKYCIFYYSFIIFVA